MSALGPAERPMRNTLDDRLRALETLLALPGGAIDELNRRGARKVVSDARTALARYERLADAPSDFVDGLRRDSGNYGRLMSGEAEIGETISWDQRDERAWRAAELLGGIS